MPDPLPGYDPNADYGELLLGMFFDPVELDKRARAQLPPLNASGPHQVLGDRARAIYEAEVRAGLRPNATHDAENERYSVIISINRYVRRPPRDVPWDPTKIVPDDQQSRYALGNPPLPGTVTIGAGANGPIPTAPGAVPTPVPSGFVQLPAGTVVGGVAAGVVTGVLGGSPAGDQPPNGSGPNQPVLPPVGGGRLEPDPGWIDRAARLNPPDP